MEHHQKRASFVGETGLCPVINSRFEKGMRCHFCRLLLLSLFMLGIVSAKAGDDLITQQVTIKLDKAGTLSSKIGSSRKYYVTNLKIIGMINGTDLRLIRDMAGRDYNGNTTEGNLAVLDLSGAQIVSGGDYYYYYQQKYNYYYTENNILGDYFFKCTKLTSVTIPDSVKRIGDYAFDECTSLTSVTIPNSVTTIGTAVFSDCTRLASVTIPNSVTTIGREAFRSCI